MDDRDLSRRVLDAALGKPDPDLESLLADDPELLDEYRRLRNAWDGLSRLTAHDVPHGARERAEAAVARAVADPRRARPRLPGRLLRVAAMLALFFGGILVGRLGGPPASSVPTPDTPDLTGDAGLERYAFVVRGDLAAADDAEMISQWSRDLWSRNRLVWAELLFPEAARRVGDDADLPAQRLFLVRAQDLEEAVELARRVPLMANGMTVDVFPTTPQGTR